MVKGLIVFYLVISVFSFVEAEISIFLRVLTKENTVIEIRGIRLRFHGSIMGFLNVICPSYRYLPSDMNK